MSFMIRNPGLLRVGIVASAILILGATSLWLLGGDSTEAPPAPPVNTGGAGGPSKGPLESALQAHGGLAVQLSSAAGAVEAKRLIESELAKGNPEAADAFLELDGVCATVTGMSTSSSTVSSTIRQYCLGYSSEFYGKITQEKLDRLTSLQAMGLDALLSGELDRTLATEGKDAAADNVDAILRRGQPAEVRIALNYAARKGLMPDDIRRKLKSIAPNELDWSEILTLSGELYFCKASGACGPQSVHALKLCALTEACSDRIDFETALRGQYTGKNYRSAESLVSYLLHRS